MTEQKQFDLQAAYSELKKACTLQAYDKVVNIAGKILTKHPNEFKAFQCKVVALIRTEKYEDCLSLIKKHNALSSYVIFEKAYVEYRLNRLNDAAKSLESADQSDLKVQELKAQVHYRKEEFEESYSCLRAVIRNSQDEYEEERLTNLAAVAAAAACFKDSYYVELDINPDMYEAKFNMACYHLGRGDCQLAAEFLNNAEATCNLSLSEDPDLTEEEKNEELAPIRVQQAYLLQLDKKEDLANQIYQSVIRQRASDPALLAVAANNIVCINREQNIFDSRKRIKMASLDGLQYKLFTNQRINMLINQALFYWHTNQMDACNAKLKAVVQENLNSRALLLNVTQLVKEKRLDKAIKLMQEHHAKLCNSTEKKENSILEVSLALSQLELRQTKENQLSTGLPCAENALKVAEILGSILPEHVVYSPGVLSTRIALYMIASSGDDAVCSRKDCMERIVDCVESTLQWYEASGDNSQTYSQLLDRCSTFLLQIGQAELAAKLCERQINHLDNNMTSKNGKASKDRQILIARLVRAYVQFDRSKAEQACRSLTVNASLSESEVDSLETAFLYGAKSVKRLGRVGETGSGAKEEQKSKEKSASGILVTADVPIDSKRRSKRKKRKIRLPKNYQPGVMPDPDRWLPRRERAHYRGKRRDKRYVPTRGPQGQVSGGSEWDASTKSPKIVSGTSPRGEISAGSTPKQLTGGARQQQRKGRKKGR